MSFFCWLTTRDEFLISLINGSFHSLHIDPAKMIGFQLESQYWWISTSIGQVMRVHFRFKKNRCSNSDNLTIVMMKFSIRNETFWKMNYRSADLSRLELKMTLTAWPISWWRHDNVILLVATWHRLMPNNPVWNPKQSVSEAGLAFWNAELVPSEILASIATVGNNQRSWLDMQLGEDGACLTACSWSLSAIAIEKASVSRRVICMASTDGKADYNQRRHLSKIKPVAGEAANISAEPAELGPTVAANRTPWNTHQLIKRE